MRSALPVLLMLAIAQPSPCQLSGSLSGTIGPGEFTVVDTIYVNAGDNLMLMPGTAFLFDGPYPFLVYGTLLAEGTESHSIIFTTSPWEYWRGLRFSGSGSSSSRFTYCLIENGRAIIGAGYTDGGGVYCNGASPTFTNCTIRNNRAQDNGGAVYCYASSPTFRNCRITDNTAGRHGGGVFLWNSTSTFTNCTIMNNAAGSQGGGVCCWFFAPTFTNCLISGNSAVEDGGGLCSISGSPTLTHCTLNGNTASGHGSGVYCFGSSLTARSTMITFSAGAGIYFRSSPNVQVEYCDIFGNSGRDFAFEDDDVSHGPPGIGQVSMTNANGDPCDIYFNIFAHPMFLDMGAGDFHLTDSSRCIGAAQAGGLDEDIEGNPRPNPPGSLPDIGAYEHEFGTPVPTEGLVGYLSGACGPGSYHVVGRIYVLHGDSLRLLPGTSFIFDGPYPFYIYGTLLAEGTESDSILFTTDTLANLDRWRGLSFYDPGSSGGQLAYCLIQYAKYGGTGGVYCRDSSPAFSNCVIKDNSAYRGGGVYCRISSPTFTNCTISGNMADYHGGGVFCEGSAAHFINCTISANSGSFGSGVCCYGSSLSFVTCEISSNVARSSGGGIHEYASSLTLTDCTIRSNSAVGSGGGVSFAYSSSSLVNCIIQGNASTGSEGGGVSCFLDSWPNFTNCTIKDNFADVRGGGVICTDSWPRFRDCAITGNTANDDGGGVACAYSWPSFTNCTITGNTSNDNGGGVYCHETFAHFNSTIVAFSHGVGIFFRDSPGSQIDYCDCFGNSGGDFGFLWDDPSQGPPDIGQLDATNANGDSCDTYMNIFLDPMFVDTAASDYHLLAGSPCIDAGDPGLPSDPDSTIADIGAFYFHQLDANEPVAVLPMTYALHPNWPNPFNPMTNIRYDVPRSGLVSVKVFNILGQEVATFAHGIVPAGVHTVSWDASGLPSSIYFCILEARDFTQVQKLVLVK